MSKAKVAGVVLTLLTAGAFLLYGVFWWTVAAQISAQVDTLWVSMGAGGAKTDAEKPEPYGFPGSPAITFKGSVTEANGTIWTFPELTYRGFPIPGFRMSLETPKGFSIQGPLFPNPIEISEGSLFILLPRDLPQSMKVAPLRAWQQKGGMIPVEYLQIRSGDLNVLGRGHLELDENLQLAGTIDSRITGMETMLQTLSDRGILKGQSAVMAQSFLQMLVKVDPVTNEKFFDTQIRIQKRGVFLGPLRIGYMPEILWDAADHTTPPTGTPSP